MSIKKLIVVKLIFIILIYIDFRKCLQNFNQLLPLNRILD